MNFMNSTFSMFDPMNKLMNPFILYTILIVMFNPMLTPKMMKKKKSMMSTSKKKFNKMISQNMEKKKVLMFQKFMMKTFTVILMFNLMSLYPFSWSMTTQISFNMMFILTLMFPIIKMTSKNMKKFLIHLTPFSTPPMLISLMIMIELTSWMIRPITLILRLSANILSGHIMLYLIGKSITNSNQFKSYSIMSISMPIMILESMVAIIQAYIIITLSSLYMKET